MIVTSVFWGKLALTCSSSETVTHFTLPWAQKILVSFVLDNISFNLKIEDWLALNVAGAFTPV